MTVQNTTGHQCSERTCVTQDQDIPPRTHKGLLKFTSRDSKLFVELFIGWIKTQQEPSLSDIFFNCARSIYQSEYNKLPQFNQDATNIYPDLHQIIEANFSKYPRQQTENDTIIHRPLAVSSVMRKFTKEGEDKLFLVIAHHIYITNQDACVEWFKSLDPSVRELYL